jgi:hypothetical protein
MQDGNFIAEHLMQVGRHRRSQANFRNQQNRGASLLQHLAHAGQIHRRLSGAGDAVQQQPANLRDATASPIFASASFCAALNSNSNGDGRGLSFEVVKSCGSSTSSINPRRTSVPSVVRGTSNPRKPRPARARRPQRASRSECADSR